VQGLIFVALPLCIHTYIHTYILEIYIYTGENAFLPCARDLTVITVASIKIYFKG
jgi:hypothetical protein